MPRPKINLIASLIVIVISLAGGLAVASGLLHFDSAVLNEAGSRIVLTAPPLLSNLIPQSGERVTATIQVQNVSAHPVQIGQLGLAARRNRQGRWNEAEVDFPGKQNFTLLPGQSLNLQTSRVFFEPGQYFAESVIRLDGKWGGISDQEYQFYRLYFEVQPRRDTTFSPTKYQENSATGAGLIIFITGSLLLIRLGLYYWPARTKKAQSAALQLDEADYAEEPQPSK